jgi:hypothetical protein
MACNQDKEMTFCPGSRFHSDHEQISNLPACTAILEEEPGGEGSAGSARSLQAHNIPAGTIRVKWPPKPELVKRRPPLLLFPGICHALTSISSSNSPVPPTLLMHRSSQAPLDTPSRRFVSLASAAPTAPPGPACLASPGGRPVSLRPRRTPTIGSHPSRQTGLASMTTLTMTSTVAWGYPALGVAPRPPRWDT